MDLEKYLKEINAQKQIDKIAKKYKNKKIVIYGAGTFWNLICEKYDISKLNIVAISDIKFSTDLSQNQTSFNAIKPSELSDFDCDVIVMALLNDLAVAKSIEKNILKESKNKNVPIVPLLSPTMGYVIKLFLGKI